MNIFQLLFFKINQFFNIIYCIYNIYYLNKYIDNKDLFEYYIKKVKNNIDNIGIFAIKLVQWGLDRLSSIYEEDKCNKILEKFNNYYENCNFHDFSHTEKLYYKDFNSNILDDFEIDKVPIASGSIGQVYKGYYKNKIKNGKKIKVAIKVLHPNIEYQLSVPNNILIFLNYIANKIGFLNKFRSIVDINIFFKNLQKQINLDIESNNIRKMNKIYQNNSFIVIPKVYKNSNNIIVMSYEEGEFFENINLSEYQKFKIIILLRIYLNSSGAIDNFMHGDLHNGNWKVRKHPNYKDVFQLVLLDFGLCIEMDDPDFIKDIHNGVETKNIKLCYDTIKKYNNIEIDFYDTFEEYFNDYDKNNFSINKIIKFLIDNNIKIKNNILDGGITTSICENHFNKHLQKVSNAYTKNNTYNFFPSLIAFCKTYNCFNEFCITLEQKMSKLKDYELFEIAGGQEMIPIDSDSELETDSECDN